MRLLGGGASSGFTARGLRIENYIDHNLSQLASSFIGYFTHRQLGVEIFSSIFSIFVSISVFVGAGASGSRIKAVIIPRH